MRHLFNITKEGIYPQELEIMLREMPSVVRTWVLNHYMDLLTPASIKVFFDGYVLLRNKEPWGTPGKQVITQTQVEITKQHIIQAVTSYEVNPYVYSIVINCLRTIDNESYPVLGETDEHDARVDLLVKNWSEEFKQTQDYYDY